MEGRRVLSLVPLLDSAVKAPLEIASPPLSSLTFTDDLHDGMADLAKRDKLHVAELAATTKELAECKAAWSLELEQMEKLEVDRNEMRSQRLAVEEQLIATKAKLLEVEEKNQQLIGLKSSKALPWGDSH
ncbi:hypothetical protein AXG93_978s1010 [Marchantia polymorpha subsp. ruderalis]|uniref:Uncharacterized protein n=1 Tax=Marchantia polymorpha subsp. ruderalis TaxID=1480154 RepID=A0A176WK99_MARPO|nr:hypothetical protein AXG93_978s1010 [Marchantia polymorpha subsp. ruderalis]